MKDLARFNKLWVALLTAVGVLVFSLAPTATEPAFHMTPTEWYQVLVAFAGSVGVFQVSNKGVK